VPGRRRRAHDQQLAARVEPPRARRQREVYEAAWRSGASKARAGERYRVTVLLGARALGWVDVQLVQNTPALATVDASRYTALVGGSSSRSASACAAPRRATTSA
jgi:hypothetical protein